MGGCASVNRKREGHVRVSSISMFNMPIYSIDYKNNCILKYSESNNLEKISMDCEENLPKYSAYTFEYPYIYILGGTDSKNPLRNEAIRINIEDFSLEYLASLPIGSKFGEVYIYNDYIYYVGAAHIKFYSIAPTPFIRLLKSSFC